MADVLIRNVSEETLKRVDIAAARAGLSRAAFLRAQLDAMGEPRIAVTMEDLRRSVELAQGVTDEELMRRAWGEADHRE